MSRLRSIALAAHQDLGSRTIARCWKFTRTDAVVVRLTECDHDLVIDGQTYLARFGLNPTAIAQENGLAVQNSEVQGGYDGSNVTENAMHAGLWDGASVQVFEVNHADLSMGVMYLTTGTIGNVQAGMGAFNAEVRGLAQALQQQVGDTYTKNCRAVLGDAKCGKPLGPLTYTGTLTAVSSRRNVTASARTEPADFFGNGRFTMTSGANAGVVVEVASFDGAGHFVLRLPLPFNPVAGDSYEVVAGCWGRFTEDCRAKFGNSVNFRGFPHVPGNDKTLGLGGTGAIHL